MITFRVFRAFRGSKILVRTYTEPNFERPPCRPVLHRCCNRTVNSWPAALATSYRPTLPITPSYRMDRTQRSF